MPRSNFRLGGNVRCGSLEYFCVLALVSDASMSVTIRSQIVDIAHFLLLLSTLSGKIVDD